MCIGGGMGAAGVSRCSDGGPVMSAEPAVSSMPSWPWAARCWRRALQRQRPARGRRSRRRRHCWQGHELPQHGRLPALRLARRRVAAARGRASPTTRARPSTPCSTPASGSRARSSRRSTASPTPRSRWFDGEKVHLPGRQPRRGAGLRRVGHAGAPRRTTRSAACSCPASSRWRRTPSSRRRASASAAAAC